MLNMGKEVDLVRENVKKDRFVLEGLRKENFGLKEDLGGRGGVCGEMGGDGRRWDEMQKYSEISHGILKRVADEKSLIERKWADGRMDTQITEKNGTLRQTEKKLAKIMGELEVLRG